MIAFCPTCHQELAEQEDIVVSLEQNCLIWKGLCCQLTPTEAEMVAILVKHYPEWVNNEHLMAGIYGGGEQPNLNVLSVMGSRINHKLRSVEIPLLVETGHYVKSGPGKHRVRYG